MSERGNRADIKSLFANQFKLATRLDELLTRQAQVMTVVGELNLRVMFMLTRSTFTIKNRSLLDPLARPVTMTGWELLKDQREAIERDIAALLEREVQQMQALAEQLETQKGGEDDEDPPIAGEPGEAGPPRNPARGDPGGDGSAVADLFGAEGRGRLLTLEPGDAKKARH